MPNIEIHGFSKSEAAIIRGKIFEFVPRMSFADDLVVTTFPTLVLDRRGNEQPYFRLIHTPIDLENRPDELGELEKLADYLREFGDVEEAEIKRFLSKLKILPWKGEYEPI